MTQTFCTLFNVNYLDKGLTLYDSLVEVAGDFKLYILAMDDKCFEILSNLAYPNIVPIRLVDFEDEELLKVKKERTAGEYCWTCSSSLIRYVLNTYQPDYCAYIDADLYFYTDPHCIIEEMERRGASVQITGHRFYADEEAERSHIVGYYCVEYNTFKNDANGRMLLEIWRNQCLEHCSIDGDGIYWADQKYMDNWVSDYPFVIETEHLGAGVAPWNIAKYHMVDELPPFGIALTCEDKPCNLLFYHFQGITYKTRREVNINCYSRKDTETKLVDRLYRPYLLHIEDRKQFLADKYGIEVLLLHHPGVKQRNLLWRCLSRVKQQVLRLLNIGQSAHRLSPATASKLNNFKF